MKQGNSGVKRHILFGTKTRNILSLKGATEIVSKQFTCVHSKRHQTSVDDEGKVDHGY